jgi:polyhydroxybutyrate depolymerase
MSATLTALAVAGALCASQGDAGTPYAAGVNCRTIQVDGHQRQYLVYVPRRHAARAPVVFMFHGSSGNGERFLRISGWREQADSTGLIAVFPTGLRYRMLDTGRRITKWNDYGLAEDVDLTDKPPGYPADAPWPADDVGFNDAMLADIRAQLPIDRRRVYASGFSNGAQFTARLAVERSEVLAAAAFSAGGLNGAYQPARPIPMYMTVGSLDDRVLALTNLPELPLDPFALLSVPVIGAMVDAHLDTLGIPRRPFAAISRRGSTTLRWPGDRFRFTVIDGLEHTYPDAAPREFWRFFQAHPL